MMHTVHFYLFFYIPIKDFTEIKYNKQFKYNNFIVYRTKPRMGNLNLLEGQFLEN